MAKNCDSGDPVDAIKCVVWGDMYIDGKEVKQDYTKARELFEKSCNGAYPTSVGCYNLGIMYALGQSVEKDGTIAKRYFSKACDLERELDYDEKHKMGCKLYKELEQSEKESR